MHHDRPSTCALPQVTLCKRVDLVKQGMQDSWHTRRVHSVPPFTFLCFQTRRCCFSCQSQDWLPMGCTSCSYSQLTRCTSLGIGTTTSRPAAALSPPKSALTLMKMTAYKRAVTSQSGTHTCTHMLTGRLHSYPLAGPPLDTHTCAFTIGCAGEGTALEAFGQYNQLQHC